MKKSILAGLMAMSMAISTAAPVLAPALTVYATTYTDIEGKITKVSDDGSKLTVETEDGSMKVKLDSNTTYEYKVLLVGTEISMDLYGGSDGYLHASKIKSQSEEDTSTVYTNQKSTIVGKITSSTTDEDLYLYLKDSGTIQIKLTSSTDLSGVSCLIANKYVSVVAAPASDGYLHAVSISDIASTSSSGSTTSNTSSNTTTTTQTTTAVETPAGQIKVSGTVATGSTSSTMLLSSSLGTYTIVIDSNTETNGVAYTTVGTSLNANVYRGNDAYLHAAKIWTGNGTSSSSTTSASTTAKTYSVSGTIASGSSETKLYLKTDSGKYTFKIDNSSTVISEGKSVKVTFYNGGDGYLHASSIKAN